MSPEPQRVGWRVCVATNWVCSLSIADDEIPVSSKSVTITEVLELSVFGLQWTPDYTHS